MSAIGLQAKMGIQKEVDCDDRISAVKTAVPFGPHLPAAPV